MLAVVPVRGGVAPAGADEAIAECGGRVLLVGSGTAATPLAELGAIEPTVVELGDYAPGRWAGALATLLADEPHLVLPASPDGRDLAPRLAHHLGYALYAGAVMVTTERISLARRGGHELHELIPAVRFVATLQPGVRGTEPLPGGVRQPAARSATALAAASPTHDATVVEVLPPDLATMDLTEARRIVGGGAGLDSAERFEQLAHVAAALGAALGATRVVTDRAWVGHERQIGSTGVVVDPDVYLAFGISGAVQHTSGLGRPDHIVSVNIDPHCPMMQMADVAIVADANAVVDALSTLLLASAAVTSGRDVESDG